MNIKKHIPNLLTLGNLFCGTIATIFAVQGDFTLTAFFVVLGIFFDFLDGFVARILKVSGELGKQLDSLADMVTSGVVPGIVMFQLLNKSTVTSIENDIVIYSYIGLLLTLGACYRLAKFNLDTRQSDSFIGLPTPAMSLFVVFLPIIQMNTDVNFVKEFISNNYFLIGISLALSYVMNAELPLFSLKFKDFSFQNNLQKYLFLITCIVLILTLEFIAIPLIIIVYIVTSLGNFFSKKAKQ